MSSSRRRGRSPGLSAQPVPPTSDAPQTAEAPASESPASDIPAGEALAIEASTAEGAPTAADEGPSFETHESEDATETAVAGQPEDGAVSEAASAQEAAPEAVSDEAVREETPEAGSAASDVASPDTAQDAAPADTPAPGADIPAPAVPEAVESVAAAAEETAEAVAQAAPLPAPAEPARAEAADRPVSDGPRVEAGFGVASLAPFTEINAKLFAFARGEGEAALAHIQALSRAKTPAEAIRLQVSEMQRAADASLTCFSDIVRSANRLGESVRWH